MGCYYTNSDFAKVMSNSNYGKCFLPKSPKGVTPPRPPNFDIILDVLFQTDASHVTLPKCPQRPTEVMSNSYYGKLSVSRPPKGKVPEKVALMLTSAEKC